MAVNLYCFRISCKKYQWNNYNRFPICCYRCLSVLTQRGSNFGSKVLTKISIILWHSFQWPFHPEWAQVTEFVNAIFFLITHKGWNINRGQSLLPVLPSAIALSQEISVISILFKLDSNATIYHMERRDLKNFKSPALQA